MASLFDLFVSISGDNSGFKKSIQDSQSDLTGFGVTSEAVTGKISDAFASLGVKMTAAGIGAFILKTGKDFQDASVQIQRATGQIGGTLDATFRNLYANSAASSEQIAGALAKLSIESRLTGSSLQSLTTDNLNFAKVTGQDVVGAVEQTQVVFKQFRIDAKDQADALDVLYAAMAATGISSTELTGQMAAIGPTARSFGLSFVQTAALVAAFHEAGLSASDVVRGLNTLFVKFAQAGKDPASALTDLISKLRDTSTSAESLNMLVDAGFSKRAAVAMADAAQRGALDIDGLAKSLENSRGKVKEVSDQTDTFVEELKKLGHEAGIAGSSIGTPLVEMLTAVIAKFREFDAVFAGWEQKFVDWASKTALWKGTVMDLQVLNNVFNPWASGNYINGAVNGGQGSTNTARTGIMDSVLAYLSGKTVPSSLTTGGGGGADTTDTTAELGDVTDKFRAIPFREKSMDAALLMKAFDEDTASAKKLVDQVYELNKEIAKEPQGPGYQAMLLGRAGTAPEVNKQSDVSGLVDSLTNASLAIPQNIQDIQKLTDAYHQFNIETPAELRQTASDAQKAYSTIKASGQASADDLDVAFTKYKLAQIELDHRLGITDDALYAQQKKNAEDTLKLLDGQAKGVTKVSQSISQLSEHISRTLGSVLIDLIGHTKKVGDTFKQLGLGLANDLLRAAENAFAKLLTTWITNLVVGKSKQSAADAGQVSGQAGVAGAAGFASVMAALPFPFNVAAAPVVAAESIAAVLGLGLPLAMFERGGNVPWNMPAYLHAEEMVLPKDIANPLRAQLAGGGGVKSSPVAFHNCSFGQGSMGEVVRQLRLAGARI